MAYTTPPTFADGNVLSASQLNILSDDVEFLYGTVRMTNTPFLGERITAGDADTATSDGTWVILHRTNTLRLHIEVVEGTVDEIRIKFSGATIWSDGTDRSSPYTYPSTIDLSGAGLSIGTYYLVSIDVDGEPGSGVNTAIVYDLREIAD